MKILQPARNDFHISFRWKQRNERIASSRLPGNEEACWNQDKRLDDDGRKILINLDSWKFCFVWLGRLCCVVVSNTSVF